MTSREQFEKEVRKIHLQRQVLRKRYDYAVDWNQIDADYFAAILAAADAHVEQFIREVYGERHDPSADDYGCLTCDVWERYDNHIIQRAGLKQ